MIRYLLCPSCGETWEWDEGPVRITGRVELYIPQPTHLLRATCGLCVADKNRNQHSRKFGRASGNSARQCVGMTKTNS